MDVVEMRRGRARVWIANVFVGHLVRKVRAGERLEREKGVSGRKG